MLSIIILINKLNSDIDSTKIFNEDIKLKL